MTAPQQPFPTVQLVAMVGLAVLIAFGFAAVSSGHLAYALVSAPLVALIFVGAKQLATWRLSPESDALAAKELSDALVQSCEEGVLVCDESLRLLHANQAAAKLLCFNSVAELAKANFAHQHLEILSPPPSQSLNNTRFGALFLPRADASDGGSTRVHVRDGQGERWLHVKARWLNLPHGRYLIGILSDVSAQVMAEQTDQVLREAGRIFIASLDYRSTLQSLAHLTVPRLADGCMIHLLNPDGELTLVAVAHEDPARSETTWQVNREFPMTSGECSRYGEALRSRQSVITPQVSDEDVCSYAKSPRHLELLRRLAIRSSLAVPLVARGRILGLMSLVNVATKSHGKQTVRGFSTDKVKLAEELALLAALAMDNAKLYEEADASNRLKDQFLATVSHELRTPMNVVLGWARMLRVGMLDETTRAKALEALERNAQCQAQIINDLLDVSELIDGRFILDEENVDMYDVVCAAIQTQRVAAQAKDIDITLAPRPPLPTALRGDPRRLQQVVWNLVSNAIKFTPGGGKVSVSVRRDGNTIETCVEDTGIGIDPAFLLHVFQSFRQEDGTSTRTYGGLGLGLAIVRFLAELHGGTVSVESEGRNLGSVFRLRLPATELNRVPPQNPPASGMFGSGSLKVLNGARVLVVDDAQDVRLLVAMLLEEAGAEVKTAASAQEAIEALEAGEFSALVADIGLPGENGYELIKRVRTKGWELPAIALTARAHQDDQRLALAAGYQRHVVKPTEPQALIHTLAALLGRTT